MPQIKEYTSEKALQGLNTQPMTTGLEYLEHGALRVGELSRVGGQAFDKMGEYANQVYKDIDQYNTSQELIHGTTQLMDLEMKQTQAWTDFAKTPDAMSPDKVRQFRDQQNQELEAFQGQFKTERGQLHFAEQIGEYQKQRFARETSDLSVVSAAHAVGAVDQFGRLSQNAAMLGGVDALPSVLQNIESQRKGISMDPNLSADAAAKIDEHYGQIKAEAVMSAAMGMVHRDPSVDKHQAIADIEKYFGPGTEYGKLLKFGQLDQLRNAAKAEAGFNMTANDALASSREKAGQEQVKAAISNIMKSTIDQNGHEFMPPDFWEKLRQAGDISYIGRDGKPVMAMTPEEFKNISAWGTRVAKGDPEFTDTHTFLQLEQKLIDHSLQPQDVIAAAAQGKLKHSDVSEFVTKIESQNNPANKLIDDNFKRMYEAAKVTLLQQINNPQQAQQLVNWDHDARAVLTNAAKTMSQAQIFDKYLNPRSPDYLAAPEVFRRYGNTIGGAAPPLPGTVTPVPENEQPGMIGRLLGHEHKPPVVTEKSPMPGLAPNINKPPGMTEGGFAAKQFLFGGQR